MDRANPFIADLAKVDQKRLTNNAIVADEAGLKKIRQLGNQVAYSLIPNRLISDYLVACSLSTNHYLTTL